MEARGSAQGSQVNTSSAVATLKAQLIANSEARSDVDRVAAYSTVVIPAATLTESTTLQSDGTTLDLRDRVHAVSLTQAFGPPGFVVSEVDCKKLTSDPHLLRPSHDWTSIQGFAFPCGLLEFPAPHLRIQANLRAQVKKVPANRREP